MCTNFRDKVDQIFMNETQPGFVPHTDKRMFGNVQRKLQVMELEQNDRLKLADDLLNKHLTQVASQYNKQRPY